MLALLEWVVKGRMDAKSQARNAENRGLFLQRKGHEGSAKRALKKGAEIRKEQKLKSTKDDRTPIDYRQSAIRQSRPYRAGGSQPGFKRKHGMSKRRS